MNVHVLVVDKIIGLLSANHREVILPVTKSYVQHTTNYMYMK